MIRCRTVQHRVVCICFFGAIFSRTTFYSPESGYEREKDERDYTQEKPHQTIQVAPKKLATTKLSKNRIKSY